MPSEDFYSQFPEVDKAIFSSANVYYGKETKRIAVLTGGKYFERLLLYANEDDYARGTPDNDPYLAGFNFDDPHDWKAYENAAYFWCLGG